MPTLRNEQADLVAFLKRPLTDDRVRWERAPFDHPELIVSDGQTGNERQVFDLFDKRAKDDIRIIPAVGAGGRAALLGALRPFLNENMIARRR